jgi:hypothetical protein
MIILLALLLGLTLVFKSQLFFICYTSFTNYLIHYSDWRKSIKYLLILLVIFYIVSYPNSPFFVILGTIAFIHFENSPKKYLSLWIFLTFSPTAITTFIFHLILFKLIKILPKTKYDHLIISAISV